MTASHAPAPRVLVLAELRRELRAWQAMNTQAERLHLTEARMQNAWTWRELLAHLTAWQEVTLARLRAAPDGAGLTYPAWAGGQNPDGQDLNAVNARIQAAARGQSWPQSHAAWERGFAEVLERAQTLSEDDLARPRDWLDGYTLLDVLRGTLTHHREEHRLGAQRWLDSQAGRTRAAER
ncbi:hypothetical protein Deipr_1827 [Deinococcus proteolyticus MRP]|uniref:DinB-like domain-containing protein n=1 Tax=Deinococcus proteolyticus (strain ATCC 35074 / DSM 20540 / JCM 6276 / NBRC 101906 / NCIMB 13154 / VKM Ac-1939 / CCM 2703 / MRP) TaxID=693977 RepID=F0RLU9_DEIPM|nr:ClbS/DfsB family four-helix bundle protein [Deinococcus proteolyticus]ADY26959.1 hypothetical protein Deipr_1827 [Deinococcus proteolyticus MRP]